MVNEFSKGQGMHRGKKSIVKKCQLSRVWQPLPGVDSLHNLFLTLKALGLGRVQFNQISAFGIKSACRWWSLSLWIRSSWRLRLPLPDVICQLLLFPPPDTRQDFLYKRYNFSSFQAKVFIYLAEAQDFSVEKNKCCEYICHTSRTL